MPLTNRKRKAQNKAILKSPDITFPGINPETMGLPPQVSSCNKYIMRGALESEGGTSVALYRYHINDISIAQAASLFRAITALIADNIAFLSPAEKNETAAME